MLPCRVSVRKSFGSYTPRTHSKAPSMMHEELGSISRLLALAQDGNVNAVNQLVGRFFEKISLQASQRLANAGMQGKAVGADDIAQSVLFDVMERIKEGQYPDLRDRNGLWALLLRVTHSRIIDQVRRENRQKRGGGKVQGEAHCASDHDSTRRSLDDFAAIEPSPETVDGLCTLLEELVDRLDPDVRQTILLRLQAYSLKEIAEQCGCSVSTVELRIRQFQKLLKDNLEE